jgi:large subunit ribosomal protein L29
MKASEFSQLTNEELLDKYRKFKEELFHVRFQLATGQLEKTHQLQALRRDLARVLTFISQRQAAAPAPAPKAKPAPAAPAPKAPKAPKAEKAPKADKATKADKAATKAAPKAKKPAAAK